MAEINTLVRSGREALLVSVPTEIPEEGLESSVRVLMPDTPGGRRINRLAWLAKIIPARARDVLTAAWHYFGRGPMPVWTAYFLQATPAEGFDAIHCHDLWTLPAAIEMRRRYCPDAKLIYDSHELFPFQVNYRIVITVNDSIADEMAKLYSIPRPAVIWNSVESPPNGNPLDEKVFRDHFGCPEEGFRVLFQGCFTAERNMENLVRAFALLDGDTHLLLLGGGPVEPALRRLHRRLGLRNVFFGPWAPQTILPRFVRRADLGIIPYSGRGNLNNLYCSPNKLFEFIEARVPICANDLPELRRIVAGSDIGDVYPMDSAEEIAEAIRDCRARCERNEFTHEARETARDRYSWATQEGTLLRLYDELGV